MDLTSPSVDRVLQALSPALTAEFNRMAGEIRQAMEADFNVRLQTTIDEVRERASEKAAYELQLAVDEARDSVRTEVMREQQQQFSEARTAIEATHARAAAGFESEKNHWQAERGQLQHQIDEWKSFAEAQRQLIDAGSQAEILIRWLKLAEPFAAGIAIYTVKSGGLALWKSRGSGVFPEIVSQETIDPEFYFRSVNVRGATVAAVCGVQTNRVDALDYLVDVMGLAIEVFGMRLRSPMSRNIDSEAARVR